ncbi:MAG: hypothetical protein HC800_04565 [Phormidesmis sp. RL_2_1]|nr:hypothetical protein [Phormidesmis sp. RL_2_1]
MEDFVSPDTIYPVVAWLIAIVAWIKCNYRKSLIGQALSPAMGRLTGDVRSAGDAWSAGFLDV